jgi:predicted 2-oxoglutarate/Fe(II)-dependent dioxygenase YbiX
MPRAEFFARHGLFVIERFFDAELCASLRREIAGGAEAPSRVERKGAFVVDEEIRRTTQASVRPELADAVHRRFETLRPELERHFAVSLTRSERPTFVVYRVGDFFLPHRDAATDDDSPDPIKARKVAVVVFLAVEADEPREGAYGGGALTLYGLLADPPWDAMAFPLVGEEGLLIAFPADMVHEVTEVTFGERFVVVTRFG